MTLFCLDASAWVKRYYRKRGSQRVQETLSGENPRACPILGLVEVIATLARKCCKSFDRIEFTLEMLEQAEDAAARWALRGADAVHFAALQSLCKCAASGGHRVVPVASDRELMGAAEALGINVLDPEIEPAG